MNKKILPTILIIYLFIQPFLDVIATTQLNKINVAIRGIFLISSIIYLLINKKSRKNMILGIIAIISIFILNLNQTSIFNSISNTLKISYLPTILYLFYNTKKNNISDKHILYTLCIYITLFITSYIFGFGYNNYLETDGKEGFRGIFNSINEISAILIGLFPISLNYLKNNKKIISQLVLIISLFITALLTGTKVLMIGLIIIMLYIYRNEIKKVYKLNKILSIIVTIFILIIGIFILSKTRFYQNMLIQDEFFKTKTLPDFINRIIFNDRLTFLNDNFKYFCNSGIFNIIFGIGYLTNSIKLVEIDIFDILFRFGVYGFILFMIPIIMIIKKSNLKNIYLFSFIFLILVSLTSGHVLLSPNVCIFFGYILYLNNIKGKI